MQAEVDWIDAFQGQWQVVQQYRGDGDGALKREEYSAVVRGKRVEITPGKESDNLDSMIFDLQIGDAGPPQQVDLIPVLSDAERQEMLQGWSDNIEPPPEAVVNPVFKGIVEEQNGSIRICNDAMPYAIRPIQFDSVADRVLWTFTRNEKESSKATRAKSRHQILEDEQNRLYHEILDLKLELVDAQARKESDREQSIAGKLEALRLESEIVAKKLTVLSPEEVLRKLMPMEGTSTFGGYARGEGAGIAYGTFFFTGPKLVVWSDGKNAIGNTTFDATRAVGKGQVSTRDPEGGIVYFDYSIELDGTGTVTIDGKDHDLASGNLFLIAFKPDGVVVKQLKRDFTIFDKELQFGEASNLVNSVKDDADVRAFFSTNPKKEKQNKPFVVLSDIPDLSVSEKDISDLADRVSLDTINTIVASYNVAHADGKPAKLSEIDVSFPTVPRDDGYPAKLCLDRKSGNGFFSGKNAHKFRKARSIKSATLSNYVDGRWKTSKEDPSELTIHGQYAGYDKWVTNPFPANRTLEDVLRNVVAGNDFRDASSPRIWLRIIEDTDTHYRFDIVDHHAHPKVGDEIPESDRKRDVAGSWAITVYRYQVTLDKRLDWAMTELSTYRCKSGEEGLEFGPATIGKRTFFSDHVLVDGVWLPKKVTSFTGFDDETIKFVMDVSKLSVNKPSEMIYRVD